MKSDRRYKKSENTSESVMSTIEEASCLLREIAGYGEPGELKKEVWQRAHRRLHGALSFRRVMDLWRQEPKARVSADELELLRRTAAASATAGELNELVELRQRIDRIEALLLAKGSPLAGAEVHALRSSLRGLGREN